MTKIVSGAQDKRLAARFYNDVDLPLQLPNKAHKDGDEMVATSQQKKHKKEKTRKWDQKQQVFGIKTDRCTQFLGSRREVFGIRQKMKGPA